MRTEYWSIDLRETVLFGRPGLRCGDDIRKFREGECVGMDWIHVAQSRIRW
jgi:hypothetical protein